MIPNPVCRVEEWGSRSGGNRSRIAEVVEVAQLRAAQHFLRVFASSHPLPNTTLPPTNSMSQPSQDGHAPPSVTIHHQGFPHVFEAILRAAIEDSSTAAALRATCRTVRDQVNNLFPHIAWDGNEWCPVIAKGISHLTLARDDL